MRAFGLIRLHVITLNDLAKTCCGLIRLKHTVTSEVKKNPPYLQSELAALTFSHWSVLQSETLHAGSHAGLEVAVNV